MINIKQSLFYPAQKMNKDKDKIIVYYDGACPKCVRDRQNYERLSGKSGGDVCWFDITHQESQLRQLGIDPQKALSELHVKNADGKIVSEMDAYILLMSKVTLLKPIAWLLQLQLIRPILANIYHGQVNRRLRKRGLL
jgi:predicted DCC family thiol-disulfide oxidoreductase YuxK